MKLLLIDNSNTRTKFRLADGNGLGEALETVATRAVTPALLTALLESHQPELVTLCSVVPDTARMVRKATGEGIILHEVSHQSSLPIGIDYPEPAQVGADRLANAVAAHARFGAPSVVIDFGTAVTFDVIGPPGVYLGGAIAPGLASMTVNLSKRTALLPQIHLEEPDHAIGKSTVEAMLVGAVLGYRGMIREILSSIGRELGGEPVVAATGGDADLIARGLPEIAHVEPDLTMAGIWRIALANLATDPGP